MFTPDNAKIDINHSQMVECNKYEVKHKDNNQFEQVWKIKLTSQICFCVNVEIKSCKIGKLYYILFISSKEK